MHGEQLLLLCENFNSTSCMKTALLLKPRLNRRFSDFGGTTPLIYLVDSLNNKSADTSLAGIDLLLASGADLEFADEEGWTPLLVAVASGKLRLVKAIIEHGAQINRKAKASSFLDGMTALMVASHHGHLKVAEYLIQRGAKLETKNARGLTATTVAAMEGHKNLVQFFQKRGGKIDRQAMDGYEEEGDPQPQRKPASHRRGLRGSRPEE